MKKEEVYPIILIIIVILSIIFGFIFNLFYYISGIIGIFAITIVLWDHFIDDRLLTRRIQLFYENIENLIFSYYKYHILEERIEREPLEEETKKEQLHLLYTHRIDNNYYSNVFIQNFDECAKYLGLTRSDESRFYVNFYINGEKFFFNKDGRFLKRPYENNRLTGTGKVDAFWSLGFFIFTEKEINIFNEFLVNLRNYWKENYTKRKMFRGKLSGKLDFKQLIET